MDQITTTEYRELRAQIEAVRAEIKAGQVALVEAMGPLRKTIEDMIKAELHHIALDLERQFGSAIALNPGSAAVRKENDELVRSSLDSFGRRLSRNAEHVSRIEDRLKALERH